MSSPFLGQEVAQIGDRGIQRVGRRLRRILQKLPRDRQSLLFSATMPSDITALAKKILYDPVRVEVTPPAATADRVEQSVYHVQKSRKRDVLVKLLKKELKKQKNTSRVVLKK